MSLRGRIIPEDAWPALRRQPRELPLHVWVIECDELPGTRPGLLVQWQRRGSAWFGQVVIATEGVHGPLVLTLWVAAGQLRPAQRDDDHGPGPA